MHHNYVPSLWMRQSMYGFPAQTLPTLPGYQQLFFDYSSSSFSSNPLCIFQPSRPGPSSRSFLLYSSSEHSSSISSYESFSVCDLHMQFQPILFSSELITFKVSGLTIYCTHSGFIHFVVINFHTGFTSLKFLSHIRAVYWYSLQCCFARC